ncbi:MAG: Uma2 family endonuclease [Actinomycetota bacterium]|nr:Uma2 family endonuclease [Actinomycetota bacterium]
MATTADPRIVPFAIGLDRYELMVERGVLGEDDHVELLKGVLSEMTPQGDAHSTLVEWLAEELTIHARAGEYSVRPQLPLRLPPASMPEPDLALVRRRPPGRHGHPEHAWLAIEISVTSQATDLGVKAELYAAAGIDELWVVDVPVRTVHVHRTPTAAGYTDVSPVTAGELRCSIPGAPAIDVGALFGVLD